MAKMTEEKSKAIIEKYSRKYKDLLGFRNHRKYNLPGLDNANIFRFTIRMMSPSFLEDLRSDKKIKNVFYNPAYTPPGGSVDSISLRYKVYIEYY